MTIRVADWLLTRLADEGIRHVFMLPGGGAMYLNDALACEPRVAAVPCHHEQAAAITAALAVVTGPHRVLRIAESQRNWSNQGRITQHYRLPRR